MGLIVRLGEPATAATGAGGPSLATRQGTEAPLRSSFVVHVTNSESRPLNVSIDVVGEAARWARVQPARLHIDAGRSDSARLWFEVPATEANGPAFLPFSVRVGTLQDPSLATSVEAALALRPFRALTATLEPKLVAGREEAWLSVAVTNHSAAAVDVSVALAETHDRRRRLRARIEPSRLTVGPGTTAGSTVFVEAPIRPRLVERHHPLGIEVTAAGGVSALAAGEFVQKPIVPKWSLATPILVGALLAAALLLGRDGPSPTRNVPQQSPTTGVEAPPAPPAPPGG